MKRPLLFAVAILAAAVFPADRLIAGDEPILELSLEEVLRLPKMNAAVYAPIRLKAGDSISVTGLQVKDAVARPGAPARGIHIRVFAADPTTGGYTGAVSDTLMRVSTGDSPTRVSGGVVGGVRFGGGAGKVQMNDINFNEVPEQFRFADGSVRLLVVAIGLEEPISPNPVPQSGPLPKELTLTAQVDQDGIALLLPAIQAAREAARR